ncbi:MAG: HlyD family efflux transporter periplasmic adaptor subunit, partial [Candidatus Omnitrophica bacterium]|nr:HlyD family efflux transporter periplasmic adaptor subunit [Candidatus Omnitrophota bacterium]
DIRNTISSTGIILPKNRLEIKPPVGGRIDEILVTEGKMVEPGQPLVIMSSTERAALLDAAASKDETTLKYWKEVYKPITLSSPIAGEVIVATIQPGQTVTAADTVVVLSDRLIVKAQVDETDIGKIQVGQQAFVTLDAYPDTKMKAEVEHIYYESKTVNNVTIYEVDLNAETVPEFCRSGMNATVDFIVRAKENILLLPSDAVLREDDSGFVLVKDPETSDITKRPIRAGVSDDRNTEIISGIGMDDTVLIMDKKYTLPKSDVSINPFMPSRRGRR